VDQEPFSPPKRIRREVSAVTVVRVDETWQTLPFVPIFHGRGESVAGGADSGNLPRTKAVSGGGRPFGSPIEASQMNTASSAGPPIVGPFVAAACLSWLAAAPLAADEVEFLRLSRDDAGGPVALETSIVEYGESPEAAVRAGRRQPLQVDLVAAVHIGSAAYYETLDRLFREYDAVLYELVAPDHARVPRPGRKASGTIGAAQQGLTKMLGLEFQLDQIDYAAANFVHADLSPQEFDKAMARRGESWWTMFTKLMQESMARAAAEPAAAGEVSVGDLFGILFGNDRELRLRRLMAEQFTDMEVLTAAFSGGEGSSLITDRNLAAMEVLRNQVNNKGRRKLAIFYGAAHMEDFDGRLRKEFGLQPRETVWLEAWDLRAPAPARGR
jgi:hypothetical protein